MASGRALRVVITPPPRHGRDAGAALHQRLNALAESFHAGDRHHRRSAARLAPHGSHFVEHSGDAGIRANQGAHADIDGRRRVGHLANVGVRAGAGILLARSVSQLSASSSAPSLYRSHLARAASSVSSAITMVSGVSVSPRRARFCRRPLSCVR